MQNGSTDEELWHDEQGLKKNLTQKGLREKSKSTSWIRSRVRRRGRRGSSEEWPERTGTAAGVGEGDAGVGSMEEASPWRREEVGEAATAKQEVEASACARACGVCPPGKGGR